MAIDGTFTRRGSLGNYPFLLKVLLALTAASALIAAAPFRRVCAYASVRPKRPRAAAPGEVARIRRAVEALGRRAPWRVVCFQSALTLQMLLRWRNIASILHYGVAHEDALSAHVWLSVAGEIVLGGDEAWRFTELACFPPDVGMP